jgi:long-chain fatty acid transport protein
MAEPHRHMACRLVLIGIGAALACAPVQALASGFALREQSQTALGNAFAGGAAAAEDPSYMFFNPASLARQQGNQVVFVGNYIAPVIKFNAKDASTIPIPPATPPTPIFGGNGGGDVADDVVVPAFYATFDMAPYVDFVENLRFGLGVNMPFGLETDYKPGWTGRYHALQSKLHSVNVNPVVSFNVIKGVSFGAGLQAQYVNTELSNAVDFGTIGETIPDLAPFAEPTQQDGRSRLEGSDWGFGYTLGVLFEPWEGTRLGFGYRSHISHKLDGDARFRLDDDGIGAAISARTGAFVNTGVEAQLDTPETLTMGFYQDITEQWAVMGDAAWTRWSRYKQLEVKFDNAAQPEEIVDTDWNDTWFFATGVTYRPNDPWALRLGFAYDQSPVPDRTRTPRIPDNDRYWVTVGASYTPQPAVELGISYAHLYGPDAPVDLAATSPGNTFRGNLSGDAEASVDIVSVQLRISF